MEAGGLIDHQRKWCVTGAGPNARRAAFWPDEVQVRCNLPDLGPQASDLGFAAANGATDLWVGQDGVVQNDGGEALRVGSREGTPLISSLRLQHIVECQGPIRGLAELDAVRLESVLGHD